MVINKKGERMKECEAKIVKNDETGKFEVFHIGEKISEQTTFYKATQKLTKYARGLI